MADEEKGHTLVQPGWKTHKLKYGENPRQQATLHLETEGENDDPLSFCKFLFHPSLETLGYNDICQHDALVRTVATIGAVMHANYNAMPLICVGAKHSTVCGAGIAHEAYDAIWHMLSGDREAIFGGGVICNFTVTPKEARALSAAKMLSCVVAPDFEDRDEVLQILESKSGKRPRLAKNEALRNLSRESLDRECLLRHVRGGVLMQDNFTFIPIPGMMSEIVDHSVDKIEPHMMKNALLAYAVGSTSKSNTITLAKHDQIIANASGQTSRKLAAKLAVMIAKDAGHHMRGAVAYSDSFFPFNDAVAHLIDAGVEMIFTTSGSKNDQKVIDLCTARRIKLLMMPDTFGRGFFGH